MSDLSNLRKQMSALYKQYGDLEKQLQHLEAKQFRVCIFGSARIQPEDPTYQMVRKLATALGRLGIDVVTGGGPGLMQAASEGVKEAHKRGAISIGLTIQLPHGHETPNGHLDIKSEHNRFSTRLDEFMRLSHAVVVAPGGIGTILELMYVWQLIQVGLIDPRPIVLLDSCLWEGFLKWMVDQPLKRDFIDAGDMNFVQCADTISEVVEQIMPALEKFKQQKKQKGDTPVAENANTIIEAAHIIVEDPKHKETLPGTKKASK